VNYFLKEEKKQFVDAQNEPHEVVLLTEEFWCGIYALHGDSYPASFDAFAENMFIVKFSFFPWGEIYVSDEALYETTNKLN
jgi:hypothetical protein